MSAEWPEGEWTGPVWESSRMSTETHTIQTNGGIFNKDALAEQCSKFVEQVSPCDQRWAYCYDRATYWHQYRNGKTARVINRRSVQAVERITGSYGGLFRLEKIAKIGLAEALKYRFAASDRPLLTVGVLEPWHVGHVYIARLADHPHIMKIGFSRRVRERLEDVQHKAKAKLLLPYLQAGTLLDEHWWHKRYEAFRISGEWFFDPDKADRSVPSFLDISDRRAA